MICSLASSLDEPALESRITTLGLPSLRHRCVLILCSPFISCSFKCPYDGAETVGLE